MMMMTTLVVVVVVVVMMTLVVQRTTATRRAAVVEEEVGDGRKSMTMTMTLRRHQEPRRVCANRTRTCRCFAP